MINEYEKLLLQKEAEREERSKGNWFAATKERTRLVKTDLNLKEAATAYRAMNRQIDFNVTATVLVLVKHFDALNRLILKNNTPTIGDEEIRDLIISEYKPVSRIGRSNYSNDDFWVTITRKFKKDYFFIKSEYDKGQKQIT